MEELRDYLNSLSTSDQISFADRCGTTIGYLRKAISAKQELGIDLVMAIEQQSKNAVRCERLLPNIDWKYLRSRPVETRKQAVS